MSDPVGYVIKRPVDTDEGDQIIFITRPSAGPFGASGTAIFACDGVTVYEHYVHAVTGHGDVVFSKDLPFLTVPRALTYPVTTTEMAQMQLTEKKEWEAVYEEDEKLDAEKLSAVKLTEDGRTKHDAQGYL
jgi:hypothetical protein